ncbi:MAG: pentapeptide repeat-containing protein, partial [Chloroflexota bacterium]
TTTFADCDLMGVNWADANWSDWASKIEPIAFDTCNLKYGVFVGLELNGAKFIGCDAQEVNFAEASLQKANFTKTKLAGAIFLRTNLTEANFVDAENYAINIHDNIMKDTRFSLPEATRLLHFLGIKLIDADSGQELTPDD